MLGTLSKGVWCLSVLAGVTACAQGGATVPDEPVEQRVFVDKHAESPRQTVPNDIPAPALQGGDGLRSLCDALQDEDQMTFTGNDVEVARAREAHRSHRAQAETARYQIDVPSAGFFFNGYNINDERLALRGTRFLVDEGAEIYTSGGGETVAFPLGAAAADRLLKMHEENGLVLRIVFRPAFSDVRKGLCTRMGGGIVRQNAELLAAYLIGGQGATLARFETDAFAQVMAQTQPVANPKASVTDVSRADGVALPDNVANAARALGSAFQACYEDALKTRPGARGKLVVEVEVGKDATLRNPRMQLSSVGDDRLAECTTAKLNGSRVAGAPNANLLISITFGPAGAR